MKKLFILSLLFFSFSYIVDAGARQACTTQEDCKGGSVCKQLAPEHVNKYCVFIPSPKEQERLNNK